MEPFALRNGGSEPLSLSFAVDQILAQENVGVSGDARVSWLLADNLGTVRDVVSNGGALAEHYKYDAYGNILGRYDGTGAAIASNTAWLTRYLYTGREFDATTGLQYNRNRWYDSKSGRWLSEDPIGFSAGDYNLYRYVGNDPTNATDPSGELPIIPVIILGAAAWWFTPSNAHAPGNQQEAASCAALDRQQQSQNAQNVGIIVGGYAGGRIGGRLIWDGVRWYFQPGPGPSAPRPTNPYNRHCTIESLDPRRLEGSNPFEGLPVQLQPPPIIGPP